MKISLPRPIVLAQALCLLVLLPACVSQPARKEKPAFQEGLHYRKLQPAQPTASGDGRIEIVEVFLYACPHCHALDPKISRWLADKQDTVAFRRMPAILGPGWILQAKAYYVAEKLGILDTIHPALMKAIHEDGKQYHNDYSLMEFFIGQGVSQQDFIEAANSPEVAENLSRARVLTVQYGLRGVPAIIVNGRYVTAQYFTGTQETMLDVVDSLIAKELERAAGDCQADC